MCKRRVIAVFLCVFMLLPVLLSESFAADQTVKVLAENGSTIQVSGVNRPIQAADELILFTRENASELTDSNVWCAAAVVDYKDGKYILSEIKDRTGAVKIPYNGFVLFGHGVSETWILDNLQAGKEVRMSGTDLPEVITEQMVSSENGTRYTIDNVDKAGEYDKLTVYTINFDTNTGSFGSETQEAIVSNNIVVGKNTDGAKGTYIPENGYVISGSGTAADFVSSLVVGEKVTLHNLEVSTLPPMYFKIKGMVVKIDRKNTERGAGEVILYETSYGSTTRTNPWGLEITAVDGKVTNIVTTSAAPDGTFLNNNSPIPQNGTVLSVQADSPFFGKLNGNINIGDPIEIYANNTYIYNAGKTSFDCVNPKSREENPAGWDDYSNTPFPGYRGADQLIVYDTDYGAATGTNPWGFEVTVNKDNKVVKIGGNNSDIPEGGYVLSGHGVKADWLKNYALVGSTIKVDKVNKTVLILFTPESMIDRAKIKIDSVKEELNVSKKKFLDVPYTKIQNYISNAELLIQSATNELNGKNYQNLKNTISQIEQNTDKAHFSNYESRKVETRAVWIRPKETEPAQVAEHLDKLKEMNINTVYLETWWGGYTIFPTENEITEQNPMYNGFDVLQAYLTEAHKRGMEVHSWVENFFIGDSGTYNGGPVYAKKPEWLLLSRKGDNFQFVDMYNINYYFANPALPEVRDFVMGIYTELIKKYDIDGLQLDYVRYPDGGDGSNDFGYDTYTRQLFKKENGVDPINILPGDALWDQWCEFRANIINNFVYRVATEVKTLNPELQISADVWPNYESGPKTLMQEPIKWVTKGYIDNIIPMSYTLDLSSTKNDILNTLAFAKDHAYVTMGLGTGTGLSKEMLIGQASVSIENGAGGIALFELESLLSVGYGNELKEGLFLNPAIVADADPFRSVTTLIQELKRKTNDIYVPESGISKKDADLFLKKVSLIDYLSNSAPNKKKAEVIISSIERLKETVNNMQSANIEVKNRIMADLSYSEEIMTNYIKHETFNENLIAGNDK